jgi:hypothetical protein
MNFYLNEDLMKIIKLPQGERDKRTYNLSLVVVSVFLL